MYAIIENGKHFNFINSNVAFILDIKKIVARNIGDNTIRSRKSTQRSRKSTQYFNGELNTSGDEFIASIKS